MDKIGRSYMLITSWGLRAEGKFLMQHWSAVVDIQEYIPVLAIQKWTEWQACVFILWQDIAF